MKQKQVKMIRKFNNQISMSSSLKKEKAKNIQILLLKSTHTPTQFEGKTFLSWKKIHLKNHSQNKKF